MKLHYCIVPVADWGQDLRVGGFLVGVDVHSIHGQARLCEHQHDLSIEYDKGTSYVKWDWV